MTSRGFTLGFDRFSGLYLWALLIAVFSLAAPATFPTMSTVHLLASTQAVAGVIALGLLVAMAAGQFDVSVGATANLAGIIAVIVQLKGIMGAVPATLLGIAAGIAVGFVNGFIVVKLKVNSFVGTLGMGSVLAALLVVVTGNEEPLPVDSAFFNGMTQNDVFGFQYVVVYLIILALVLWWVLEKTPAGRYIYATGSNPEAARLSGVAVDKWSWIALTASGGICGLGGVLFVSLTGPSLGFGNSLLLPAFAAVFLGSTQLTPGKRNVWGTLLAIFVIATGVQGLQLVSGAQWVSALFNGLALIAAVALAARERRALPGRAARRLSRVRETPPKPAEPVAMARKD
ncbi:ABC transporter permease [Saccharopolyspora spinosa]|uniref:Monosaccharide ABC transporter membrane protein (CUT2 family) n=1 Tax=Saccharopolyspora spinosa TaxID=60894 RepID=A0A2N3Y6K8_SACSN|nr:ABC transporter permease [Saccharopolyspora spinosa]PKW18564.1 monosaccharide ABC transporter membrane protein (CUT2 family) [Saccharopolyspora spinosa]